MAKVSTVVPTDSGDAFMWNPESFLSKKERGIVNEYMCKMRESASSKNGLPYL